MELTWSLFLMLQKHRLGELIQLHQKCMEDYSTMRSMNAPWCQRDLQNRGRWEFFRKTSFNAQIKNCPKRVMDLWALFLRKWELDMAFLFVFLPFWDSPPFLTIPIDVFYSAKRIMVHHWRRSSKSIWSLRIFLLMLQCKMEAELQEWWSSWDGLSFMETP